MYQRDAAEIVYAVMGKLEALTENNSVMNEKYMCQTVLVVTDMQEETE